jgi:hypothetical protein
MGLQQFNEKSVKFLADIKESLTSVTKISLAAAWKFLQTAIAQLVIIIEETLGDVLAGPEKKAQAMAVAEQVVDTLLVAVVIPFIPALVKPILNKYIKQIFMQIVSGSIDAIVSTFHTTNVFPPKVQ